MQRELLQSVKLRLWVWSRSLSLLDLPVDQKPTRVAWQWGRVGKGQGWGEAGGQALRSDPASVLKAQHGSATEGGGGDKGEKDRDEAFAYFGTQLVGSKRTTVVWHGGGRGVELQGGGLALRWSQWAVEIVQTDLQSLTTICKVASCCLMQKISEGSCR